LLVSDQARERTTRRLARAYAKGRLDHTQLEQRTEQALAARTRADLVTATRHLPRSRWTPPTWLWPVWPLVIAVRSLRRAVRTGRARTRGGRRSA
jgi:Domain of unknown function (DUF1707)